MNNIELKVGCSVDFKNANGDEEIINNNRFLLIKDNFSDYVFINGNTSVITISKDIFPNLTIYRYKEKDVDLLTKLFRCGALAVSIAHLPLYERFAYMEQFLKMIESSFDIVLNPKDVRKVMAKVEIVTNDKLAFTSRNQPYISDFIYVEKVSIRADMNMFDKDITEYYVNL